MAVDLIRLLQKQDLSEAAVLAFPLREARTKQAQIRAERGLKHATTRLLTHPNGNLKLTHSATDRVAAYGLALLPADSSGLWNTCRWATKGCREACLATSGQAAREQRSGITRIYRARRAKLALLATHPQAFLRILAEEIDRIPVAKWHNAGFTCSLRLNVITDLDWSLIAPWIIQRATARTIKVYDYTKEYKRATRIATLVPALDWDLSMSVHENTTPEQIRTIRRPVVVFSTTRAKPLPTHYLGRPVVDGDLSDARYLDPPDVIVGLRYKNVSTCTKSQAIESGFCIKV